MRRILYFLLPIIHPEKPKRVTLKLGGMVVAALKEGLEINWASILLEVMKRQLGNIKGAKAISLSTYLYQYYEAEQLLTKEEIKTHNLEATLIKYGCVEEEKEAEQSDESEADLEVPESPPVSKKRKLVKNSERGEAGSEQGSRPGTGPNSGPNSDEESEPELKPDHFTLSKDTEGNFSRLGDEIAAVRRKLSILEMNMALLAQATGSRQAGVVVAVLRLVKAEEKKQELAKVKASLESVKRKLETAEEEKADLQNRLCEYLKAEENKQRLQKLLEDYLGGVMQVVATGGRPGSAEG